MVNETAPQASDLEILAVLGARGPLARADLSRATGRSMATVSRAVDRLRAAGLVRERPTDGSGPGRPPRLVEVRPEAASVVGIDAGGSMLRAVRADLDGAIRARAARPARDVGDARAIAADVEWLVDEVRGAAGEHGVLGIVAGVSGIVSHAEGRVLVSPDLPGLEGVALASNLESRLGVPVAIDNDDLLAAVGEASHGAARGCRDVAFLSFGYGLGAGLIVDGRPVRGTSSAAGAVAFLGGRRLEERASGRSIPIRYAEACAEAGQATDPFARLDARGVFDLATRGDPVAGAVVARALDAMAEAVLDVAALLDPEVIVLGGGLANDGRVFDAVGGRLQAELPYPPRLAASSLGGSAVLQGAVSLALAIAHQGLSGGGRTSRAEGMRPVQLELA
jgi:predicted NBD/HSP70 family sugar kinase